MLTGEVKKRLIEVLSELVERHQRARASVTDEVRKHSAQFPAHIGQVGTCIILWRSDFIAELIIQQPSIYAVILFKKQTTRQKEK